MLGAVTSGRLPAGGACASGLGAGAVAFAGRLGDGRVLIAAAALRFLAVFFFGFGVLPRAARAFTRARLVFREPADLAFRRLVRSAIEVDPSEVARGIQDSDVIRLPDQPQAASADVTTGMTSSWHSTRRRCSPRP